MDDFRPLRVNMEISQLFISLIFYQDTIKG